MQGLFDFGALPVLERTIQFTESRHRVLTDNIANLSTPNYRPKEMSVESFQQALGDAIDRRRSEQGGPIGGLEMRDTADLAFGPDSVTARTATPADDNLLFHDRNNRSLETTMQALAENTMVHNAAMEMLRSEFSLLQTAIQERV